MRKDGNEGREIRKKREEKEENRKAPTDTRRKRRGKEGGRKYALLGRSISLSESSAIDMREWSSSWDWDMEMSIRSEERMS